MHALSARYVLGLGVCMLCIHSIIIIHSCMSARISMTDLQGTLLVNPQSMLIFSALSSTSVQVAF